MKKLHDFVQDKTAWLTQKWIAKLFGVNRSVVTKHLKNMFYGNEFQEDSVRANFAHTAEVGKQYQTKFYSSYMLHINETFSLLRDTLLPKLMSGEVRVQLAQGEAAA